MATAAANDATGFIAPGDVVPLDPNEIDLGARLRPIDTAWATAIGQSMKRDGQIHAVDVRRIDAGPLDHVRWQLAGAGGHRVTGARLAGIAIEAKVVVFNQDVARRREAAENLFRRANDPLERAEAIAELVRLHRELAGIAEAERRDVRTPKRLREEADGHMEIISMCYGWSDEIGAEIGLTGRTIRNDLFLYRSLQPSVIQHLREAKHPVLKNATQLRALAKLERLEQVRAVSHLLNGTKSASEAIRITRGSNSAMQSPEDRRLSSFLGAFNRMGLSEKRGALAQLASMIPAPFQLVEAK